MPGNLGYPARLSRAGAPQRGEMLCLRPLLAPMPAIVTIAGVTRDAAGVAVAGATVKLYRTVNDVEIAAMVSDANGNYSFTVNNGYGPFYLVAYIAGAPDRAGTTVNTLLAT